MKTEINLENQGNQNLVLWNDKIDKALAKLRKTGRHKVLISEMKMGPLLLVLCILKA